MDFLKECLPRVAKESSMQEERKEEKDLPFNKGIY